MSQQGRHRAARTSRVWVVPAAVLLVAALVLGCWAAVGRGLPPIGGRSSQDSGGSPAVSRAATDRAAVPAPVVEHHGNSPDCPDTDCIAMLVNGDLLFHKNLWKHFAGPNEAATDGTAFDFDPLFEPMRRYIDASDIAVCNFETPVAPRGGPYADYPVFNIPPEVADSAAHVGYTACTTATNHWWDRGADGIARTLATLDQNHILHTGAYTSQEASEKPLVIDSPTGGGKLGLIAGTVSLNGATADPDWMVDRLRDFGDPHHQSDIDRAVVKANAAREQGADVVAITIHSINEYIDYADSWQVAEAHALADTGAFDLIYGTGSHSAQPIEYYNGTWIIYGLGNALTVTTHIPGHQSNNEGVTARVQFAGKKGEPGTWRVSRIDWLPTASERQGTYQWCPMASDHPDGLCWNEAEDQRIHSRIQEVLTRNNPDPNVVREWRISEEGR